MDNPKLPAYPLPIARHNTGSLNTTLDVDSASIGFTKLELASLMAMQGILSGPEGHQYTPDSVASSSVSFGKAVLEEANR